MKTVPSILHKLFDIRRSVSIILILITIVLIAGWISVEWNWINISWIRDIPFEPLIGLFGIFGFGGLGFNYFAPKPEEEVIGAIEKAYQRGRKANFADTLLGIDQTRTIVQDTEIRQTETLVKDSEKTRDQSKQQFDNLNTRHDETQSGVQDLQSEISQVSEDVRNLPKRMKEQELIERLISAADNFEYRFRHTYAKDQLGALQEARIDFDKLRALAKFQLSDELSDIYDVFHRCCMELAFAIKGLAKSPIPLAQEEKWNSVCCGSRRKELDSEVKIAYGKLYKKLHEDRF